MPLRPLPYREVKRKLEAAGFTQVSQKGSHVKFLMQSGEGTRTAIVPRHREVAVGTLPTSWMRLSPKSVRSILDRYRPIPCGNALDSDGATIIPRGAA